MPLDPTQPTTPETIFDIPAADLPTFLQAAAYRNPILHAVMTAGMQRHAPFNESLLRATILLADGMNQMAAEMAAHISGTAPVIATTDNLRELFAQRNMEDGQ